MTRVNLMLDCFSVFIYGRGLAQACKLLKDRQQVGSEKEIKGV